MSLDAAVHGVILGLVYGMLGAGLVLAFRASGVVNFALGEAGVLAATILAKLVLDEHWPFLAAVVAVLAIGAVIGAVTEKLVVGRRPQLVVLVATIGLAQLLLVVHLLLPSIRVVAPFPTPLHRRIVLGSVVLIGPDFAALAAIPAVVVALWMWLTRTPSGLALRAVGDNRDAAELAGIRPARVATAAWALAGALATLTAVLANPLQGVAVGRPSEALGVGLLLRALAAAMVGRLRSLPLALAGGVAVGLIQAAANAGHVDPAVADLGMLVFVLGVALVRPKERGPATPRSSAARMLAPVPPPTGHRIVVLSLAAAAAAPLVVGRSTQLFSLSRVALYAMVGLSLVVLTGWAGQLSLGQFALVGVGTFSAAVLQQHGVPFWITLPSAAAVGAAVSAAVGLPALRVGGVELAVTTLALAVACSGWLFTRSALLDRAGVATVLRANSVRGPVAYYEVCITALAVTVALTSWIRGAGFGRRLLAVRSDERRAAALGIGPVTTKLAAFALAGAVAATAGVLLGGLRVHSTPGDFGPGESLRIVAITVIGGAGSVAGALLGAVVVLGVPALFGSTTIAGLVPSGVGLLALALVFPGGLAGLLRTRRPPGSVVLPALPAGRGGMLAVAGLTVRYGGRLALDAVDLDVHPGEVVAVVGANGAGKSTLLDAISGYAVPDAGTVTLDGRSLLTLPPSARARAGVGRVVQDSRVFDDLTVAELMLLAGGDGGRPVDVACQDLPTGQRRLVEIAAAMTRRPKVLLLDEPTAGLAAEEVEQFIELLDVVRAGDTAVVLVEHDAATVSRVADRVVRLDAGRVVATPLR